MDLFFLINVFNIRKALPRRRAFPFKRENQPLKTKILLYNRNCTTFAALSS